MKKHETFFRRAVAFLLTLAMVFGSEGFVPGIATVLAEGTSAISATEQQDENLPISDADAPTAEERQTSEEAVTEEAPAPVEEAATEEVPAPAEEAATEEAPAPAEEAVTEEAPAPVEEVVTEEAPASAEEAASEEEPAPAEEAASEEEPAPAEEAASEEEPTPAEEAASEEEPAPAEEAASEEEPAPAEEAASEEEPAPAEEAATEEDPAPAEEAASEEETAPAEEAVPVEEPASVEEVPADEDAAGEESEPRDESVPAQEVGAEDETASEEAEAPADVAAEEVSAAQPDPEDGTDDTDPAVGLIVVPQGDVNAPAAGAPADEEVRTLHIQVGDYEITATGSIPEGAEIQAVEIPAETAEKMTSKKLLFAYDIRLLVDGKVWQPEEHGTQVEVSVKDLSGRLDGKSIDIVHMKADLMDEDGRLSDEAVEKAVQGLADGSTETERIDTETDDGAVAFGTGSFSGFLGTAMAKLQELFKEAMQSRQDGDKKVKLNLEKDTTYEGDVEFSADQYEVEDDFEVELVAEDAGEDRLQSEGTTTVAGNITIKGINVRMIGISIAAGNKVTVQDAKLDYYGTKKDDTLNVEVSGSKGEASIATGEGDDTLAVNASDAKASVDTGDGDDELSASLDGSAALTADTGDGSDTVNLTMNASSTASVVTGDGGDKVSLTDASVGKAQVDTGSGNDTVDVRVTEDSGYSAGEIQVSTGAGDDSVNLSNPDGKSALAKNGNISVDLGSGVNNASLDVNVAGIASKVTIESGEGNDHVHLTGALDGEADQDERVKGDAAQLSIAAEQGNLELKLNGVETLTDDLENKRTVELTTKDAARINFSLEGAQSFTNYVLKSPASKLGQISIRAAQGKPALLSNVVIDTDTTWDGENKLVISEGSVIDVRGLNLQLKARNIEIDGTIKADVVQIEALDGTGIHNRNLKDQYSAFKGTIDVPVIDQVGSGLAAGVTTAWDLVNIKDDATIRIGEKGSVLASGDVVMLAKVEQSGTMISVIPTNVVNVKVAHATIDIAGKVYAGVTNMDALHQNLDNVQVGEGHGTVRADAQISTSIGYDSDGKAQDGFLGMNMPLAVSVAYTAASVSVKEGAVIEAAKDIRLASKSEQKVSSRADSGLFGLPASVAVAVLVNDAQTEVNGRLHAHSGNVKVEADGTVDAKTYAYKGSGQESKSGGYAAVSVVLQDVKAEIGSKAVVDAAGKVQVLSHATEKLDNRATSGSISSEQSSGDDGDFKTMILGLLTENLWPAIIDKIFSKEDTEREKLDKAMKKIVTSNHSVKLDDDAQQKGEVKVTIDESQTTDNAVTGKVTVKPWGGYKVKSITWRGYNPGDSAYKTGKIETANGAFVFPVQNVTIFVEYEEAPEYDEYTAADLFDENKKEDADDDLDIDKMLSDIEAEIEADDELDRELKDLSDGLTVSDLKLEGDGGAVLTYETDPEDDTKCLGEVYLGQKLRLIPNPAAGKKLKAGGLKAIYYITETKDDVEVVTKKTAVINADDRGNYYFTVPNDMDPDQNLTIRGEFEDGQSEKSGDETQTQLTGTLAVAVTDNDNQAVIREGAVIRAGSVEVQGTAQNDIANVADGTAVDKASAASGEKKSDDLAIQRPAGKEYSGYDAEGMEYGLLLDAAQYGTVTWKKDTENGGDYSYVIEAVPDEGCRAGSAMLTYYVEGKKKTVSLEPGPDGRYRISLSSKDFGMDPGSTAVVAFSFVRDGEEVTMTEGSVSAPQVVIAHPIQITYNAIKGSDDSSIGGYKGKVTYAADQAKTDDEGRVTSYAFKAEPESGKGYKLDGALKATYKDASGKEQTTELKEEDGIWYLSADGIPAGSPIKVTGAFTEDLHAFAVDSDNVKNGTVTLHDEKVKLEDKPKVTVKASAGYSLEDIVVTYEDSDGEKKTIKLSDKKSKLTKAKNDKGEEIADTYTFTVPGLNADSDIKVSASFKQKAIGLNKGEGDKDQQIVLSENFAAAGDKITVTPTEDKIKEGYKVSKVTVTAEGKTDPVVSAESGLFTIPKDTDSTKLTVKAELELKEVVLKKAELANGTVTPNTARADRGETVTLTVKPKENFKVKTGTLKAIVRDADGSTEEIFLLRQNDTTYTFDMPGTINKDAEVTFIGEFEAGMSDSSQYETSLGAGIAVTVSNSESRADIMGSVASKGNVTLTAENNGGVKTEAKAGYSKGNVGVGGAVAVQVASMDAKALVHKTASLATDGRLNLNTAVEAAFGVTGDASGNKSAGKTGVGAGIAVAVNGSDAFAAVQEGTTLTGRTVGVSGQEDSTPKGISVTAVQKLKDSVKAKAGAAGGTAVVPVAAVDVTSGTANAYVGRLSTQGRLKVGENVSVSSSAEAEHDIQADASAAGKGAGIGGAFAVSVVSDSADAKLSQSVEAAQVTVTAQNLAKLSEAATASASGGKKDSNSKSSDKKADGLISLGGNLAGKNKSSGVSGGQVGKMTKDRQKAETSEGTVGVSASVAVNVQHSASRAEITDGVNIKSDGLVAVTAVNGTESRVKANSSTTNSTTGVGVGVAVNVLFLDNIAQMGDGEIQAAMLKVAATTRETTPESADKKQSEPEKIEDTEGLTKEITDMVTGYIKDLAAELGMDNYVPEDLMDKILKPVIKDVTGTFLDATRLGELFASTDDIKGRYEALKNMITDPSGLFAGFPEELFGPLMETIRESGEIDLGVLSADDLKTLTESILEQFKTNFTANMLDMSGIGSSLLDTLVDYLKDKGLDMLQGVFTGDQKVANLKKYSADLAKVMGKAVVKEIKGRAEKTVKDTFSGLKIPEGISLVLEAPDRISSAFSSVKDAWQQLSLENIYEKAAARVVDSFKTKVFDYEVMMEALSAPDFSKKIADGIRKAAKDAQVTLTNEALGRLMTKMDVVLEPDEATATGHIVDTQAISGAGATDVGVAGSVAITVLNATTKADIRASENKIDVKQGMTVEAKELRSVKNVSSAAVDRKGNAEANKSAEKAANQDAGGGNDATSTVKGEHMTLEARAGATARVTNADSTDARPKVYIAVKEGYRLAPEKVDGKDKYYAQYSYTDKKGKEVTGKVEMTQSGEEWVVDPSKGDLAKLDDDIDVRVVVAPEEVLRELPAVSFDFSEVKPAESEKDPVTLTVKGREQEDGKTVARAGEKVEITVKKAEGRHVKEIGISYKDAEGNYKDVYLPVASNNEKEITYVFDMPDAEVEAILVNLVENGEDYTEPATSDGSGKTVGVGAAFSMVYGDVDVKAQVGKRSEVKAGEIAMNAQSEHQEDISSAAGTDPLSGEMDTESPKDYSLDASVSLNILDHNIQAEIGEGTSVNTREYAQAAQKEGSEETAPSGDLSITSKEDARTETTSSAFAAGGLTAVGASVAINIADSNVNAKLLSGATVGGSATVASSSHSEDKTTAVATAMGADIARNLAKAGETADNIAEKSNKVLDGSVWDEKKDEEKKSTETGNKINKRLDEKKNTDKETGKDSAAGNSISGNALRTQGVNAASDKAGEEGKKEINDQLKEQSLDNIELSESKEPNKVQVAAAVGLTIASHSARTETGKIDAGKGISATAENTGNFNTMGTGASMSLAKKANSIAFGVAVSVNSNTSGVKVDGDLTGTEDVNVTSKLTQNMDGDFRGKLAAQSLAGSVAGKDSGVSLAGAVSVVVSKGKSTVDITGGTAQAKRQLSGAKVNVEATDKSKIAARAGGVSISRGSSVGMGIASTTIVSGNTVTASIGDHTKVKADTFSLNAQKLAVTQADYKNLINMRYLVTDSSALSDEQRKQADTGLIDFHKEEGSDSYKMEVNLSSEKLLEAVDGLNFLSSQNTYAEAIGGSVIAGDGNALAGSVAVAVDENTVEATLGKHAEVELKDGNMTVNAANGNTARLIAGSVAVAAGKKTSGGGLSVSVLVDNNKVNAEIGENAEVSGAKDFTLNSETTGDIQAYTVAAAVASGSVLGGAVNVIVSNNRSETHLGDGANIRASGDAKVNSKTDQDLMTISVSAPLGLGQTAAGGTVNVVVDKSISNTAMGSGVTIEQVKSLTIASDVRDQLISGTASASMAISTPVNQNPSDKEGEEGKPQQKTGSSFAGVVNVIVSKSAANTSLDSMTILRTREEDLSISAKNDAWMLNASLALAANLGQGDATGASINVNVFNRDARVTLKDAELDSARDLIIASSGKDTSIMAGLSIAGSVGKDTLSGNVGVLVEKNRINTLVENTIAARARGNAILESYYSDYTVGAAGTIAGGGNSATGATILTVVKSNNIRTKVGNNSHVAAEGKNARMTRNLLGKDIFGVYVGANAKETQIIGGAGVALAGSSDPFSKDMFSSLNGVVTVLVNNNKVYADASGATLLSLARKTETTPVYVVVPVYDTIYVNERVNGESRVVRYTGDPKNIRDWSSVAYAKNKTGLIYIPRSLEECRTGYTRVLDRYDTHYTYGKVNVAAQDDTTQTVFAGGLSISRGSGLGAAVVTIVSNKDVRSLAHNMTADEVNVTADNSDKITQVAVSAGVSAEKSAVQIGASVQVLQSQALAEVDGNVTTNGSDFNLTSNNTTDLNNAAVTLAVGGSNAITPVGIVTYFRGESQALLKENAQVSAEKNVNIQATADKSIAGYTIGASAAGGLGLSGAVNVIVTKDKTKASANRGSVITSNGGDVNIKAHSDYKLRAESAAVALSVGADPTKTQAAVAINAVVSVLQGNTIAQLDGSATAKDNKVNVNAFSKRDVIDAAASVSGGVFGTSVGVTMLALVAGAKMSQDAADMLVYGNADKKSSENTTFDVGKFMAAADANGSSKYYDSEIVYDEDGNPVMEDVLDENGNPVLDENGNVRQQEKRRATADDYVYDDNGDYVMENVVDENGFVVMEDVLDENGNPVMETVLGADGEPEMEDVLDENGDPVLDENGNPQQTVKQRVKQQPKQQRMRKGTLASVMKKDLMGNGHRESEQTIGGKSSTKPDQSTFDATSKYRSSDFDKKNFKDSDETGRGENLKTEDQDGRDISDTADVKKAKNANVYKYEDPTDAVIARITANATVEAKAVSVEAAQPVSADVIGAAIAAGSRTSVGVSAAFAMLHSNVIASSNGTISNATDGVTIRARSVSGEFDEDASADERSDALSDYMSNSNKKQDQVSEKDLTATEKEELEGIKDSNKREERKQQMLEEKKAKVNQDKKSLKDDLLKKLASRSIRVFGVAVGVGSTGVAVSAAVALTDNVTRAELGGTVNNAGDVNVNADHNYGSVMAATGSVAAGGTAVAASVAVAQANGSVKSLITANGTEDAADGETYDISSTGNVNVSTTSRVDVDALAASVGIGGTAVNAGVALAFNRLTQETGMVQGVRIKAGKDVNVTAASDTASNTYLLGVAAGSIGVSLNAAVSDVAVKVDTHIGNSMPSAAGETSDSVPAAVIKALNGNVNVRNQITSSALPKVLSVAAGAVAAGGNVLLAFNDSDAQAMVDNASIEAKNLTVAGNLSGTADSSLLAAQVGFTAVGVSVNYADMQAANRAVVMNSAVTTSESTKILTNENNEATSAKAHTISASLGAISVGMNAAIARNRNKSYATLVGDKQLDVGELTVHAKGKSSAKAEVEGISIGLVSAAATAVVALNDADARTSVLVGNTTVRVDENGNPVLDEEGREYYDGVKDVLKAQRGVNFNASQEGETNADILTGGGSIASGALSVGLAYGRTNSIIDVAINGGGNYAYLKSANNASDKTNSNIRNAAFSALSATGLYGAAYSQDLYRTKIKLTGGDYVIDGNADVTMDYTVTGNADVQPSAGGGVDLSLASMGANIAVANNTAYAGTDFEVAMGKNSQIKGDANVKTEGLTFTNARVRTARITAAFAKMTANIAKANLSMEQAANMRVGGTLGVGGSINVESLVKDSETEIAGEEDKDGNLQKTKIKGGTAIAGIGAGGKDEDKPSVSVSVANLDVSTATAKENLTNSAVLMGAAYKTEDRLVGVDKGKYVTKVETVPNYDVVTSIDYKLDRSGYEIKGSTKSDQEVKSEIIEYYVQGTHFGKWGNLDYNSTVYEFTNSTDRGHMLELIERYRTSFTEATELQAFLQLIQDDNRLRMVSFEDIKDAYKMTKHKAMSEDFAQALEEVATTWAVTHEKLPNELEGETEREQLTFGDYLVYFKHREKWPDPNEDYRTLAYRTAVVYGDVKEYDLFDWTETYHYATEEQTTTKWESDIQFINGKVEVFDTDRNHLNVGKDLNIRAAMAGSDARTMAQARTDGAKTAVNLLSAGSMEANAKSSDHMSAMLEGMHATVAGAANLKAESNTFAEALGYKSGGLSGFSGGSSNMMSSIGSADDQQSASVVIGSGSSLTAHHMNLEAINRGSTESRMDSGKIKSAASISSSSLPTYSFYNTLVSVGEGAKLTTKGGRLYISAEETPTAKSRVETKSMGIGLDFGKMKGQNFVKQELNIDIGSGAELIADAAGETNECNVWLRAQQSTDAHAEIISNTASGLVSAAVATAENNIERIVRVNIADGAHIESTNHKVFILADSGEKDNIYTRAYVDSAGLVSVGNIKANADINAYNEVLIGKGVSIKGEKDVEIAARFMSAGGRTNWDADGHDAGTGSGTSGYKPGIYTEANIDSKGGVPVPKAVTNTNLNVNNYIGINRRPTVKEGDPAPEIKETTITSTSGPLTLTSTAQHTTVYDKARALGKGAAGVANATAWIKADIANTVWIDDATLLGGTLFIRADNGSDSSRAHLIADSYTELKALAGKVAPTSRISGLQQNQIRSTETGKVALLENKPHTVRVLKGSRKPKNSLELLWYRLTETSAEAKALLDQNLIPVYDEYTEYRTSEAPHENHKSISPENDTWNETHANYKRWQKKILGITITLTKANVTNKIDVGRFNRCDFCDEGDAVDVNPTPQAETMQERYRDAYNRALGAMNVIEAMARALSIDQTALMGSRLAKGLLPLTYMNTLATRTVPIPVSKARYGEEENKAASMMYVLDVKSLLEKDVRIDRDKMSGYRMWMNNATFQDVYMLPNATRMYMSGARRLEYVTDILKGDVLGNGSSCEVEVMTALTENAFANPQIPVGSTGTLDFATGILMIPSHTDYELYLHEVSAAWLVGQMEDGMIRTLMADQSEINDCARDGSDALPEGTLVEGLTDGGEVEGIRLYWIGDTPETAADPDQNLLLLMVNEQTDEIDAFRTTCNRLAENEPLTDISMYIYRDSRSDSMEIEKYNVFWFDTQDESMSLVKVVTNVLGGRNLEMPRPIRIPLRAYHLAGADMPVYSLSDHLFVMCNGSDGHVSLFDDFYQASYDGDVFESNYIRIEGISTGEIVATLKKNQEIWPEHTGKNTAEDIGGKVYNLVDGEWVEQKDTPALAEETANDAA